MERNGFLALILLFLIVADASNASLVWKSRKLVGAPPKDNSTLTQKSNPNPIDSDTSGKEKSKDSQVPNNSTKVDPKGSNNTGSLSPPTNDHTVNEKNHEATENNDNKTNSRSGTNENCDGSLKRCRVRKTMIACIQAFESGSKELVLLVQNEGESALKVNLTMPTLENDFKELEIPKHKTKRINISLSVGESTKIVLNAGKGDCVLHMGPPVSEGNFFLRLPSFSELVTPIYGAYFLFLTALIVGGMWACCKFRKSRRQGEVPYQELEMGFPESVSAVTVDTAEGWDEDWDDDWDEDKAVKSPGGRHVGSISANGITSRSSNKNGWENDWGDD